MRAHIVENGIITNAIEVDSLDAIPGLIDGSIGSIGWSYQNGVLTQPPPTPVVVPEQITRIQAKRELVARGLYQSVNAAVATMTLAAQIEWTDGPIFKRQDVFVLEAKTLLGWTDAIMDEMFISAAGR